jgi:hypothetical protein
VQDWPSVVQKTVADTFVAIRGFRGGDLGASSVPEERRWLDLACLTSKINKTTMCSVGIGKS